jgi:flagellar hook-associated protein 1
MSSLLESLSVGTRGLAASQTALSVAGQNITNAETEGYSRKSLKLSAEWRPDGKFGEMGFGVEADKVARMRDTLLDRTIIGNQAEMGMQEQLNTAMTRMEALLSEPKDQGLGESMNAFWNAWQDLANNPSDVAARQAVIDSSQATISKFNALAEGLQGLRADQDMLLNSKLKEINDLTARIASNNLAIAAAEAMPNGNAGDSRDDRGLALEKLGRLMNIDYLEDAQGRLSVTCNGQMLVSPTSSIPLIAENTTTTRPDGTAFTLTTLRVSNTRQQFSPVSGEIAGILQARDKVITKSQSDLDAIAATLVRNVNDIHRQGYDSVGTNGTSFFDPTKTTASTMCLLSEIASNPAALAAGAGGTSQSVTGVSATIPAGGTSLNLAKSVNPLYRDLMTGSVVVRTVGPPSVTLEEGPTKDFVVDSGSGEIKFINALAYPEGTGISVDFRYNTSGTRGAGDGRNALSIAQLKNRLLAVPDALGKPTATLVDAYADYVGTIGANHTMIMSKVDTLTSLSTFYQNQAQTVSGVNLDEEMTDLVKFQHSYQASAKFISTVDKLLESVINL